MGLFPEADGTVADTTSGVTVAGGTSGTPNVRRRLFSAASDLLAAVGSTKSAGSAGDLKLSDRLTDSKTSALSTTKITTSTSAATVSFSTNSSSMQQLSTSWEFLRLVAQMYTILFNLQHNVHRH